MAKNIHRNSQLQQEIVALLKKEPNLRVTKIAEKLGRYHSSISRSGKLLKDRAIVIEEEGMLRLRSRTIPADLVTSQVLISKRAVSELERIASISLRTDAIHAPVMQCQKNIARSMLPAMQAVQSTGALLKNYSSFMEQVTRGIELPLIEYVSKMTIIGNEMAGIMKKLDLTPIYSNLAYLSRFQERLSEQLQQALLLNVANYNSFLELASKREIPSIRVEKASIFLSTGLSSLSYYIREENDKPQELISSPVLIDEDKIDSLLSNINLDLVEIKHGAWHAFRSESPDRNRQASHSMRELLRLVISSLCSDEELTRKEKVKAILHSKTEANLICSLADSVDVLYRQLSNFSHTNKNRASSVEFALATTQNIIVYLLSVYFEFD